MPSMKWLGGRWHVPSDAIPIVAAATLFLNIIWLILYIILMLVVTHPTSCGPGQPRHSSHYAVVWGVLAFVVANVLTSALLIVLGTRGTPLTPSTRRPVEWVITFDMAKYLAAFGFLIWALYDVYQGPPGCWSSDRKLDIEILLWCTLSVLVLVAVIVALAYDAMSSKPAQQRWRLRVKIMARVLGCYQVLMHPWAPPGGDPDQQQQQVINPLQEISAWLARLYGAIDLEKSDVMAGIVLASVMQAQQRRALAAVRLKRAGVQLSQKGLRAMAGRGVMPPHRTRDGVLAAGNGGNEPLEGQQLGTMFEQTVSYLEEECNERKQHDSNGAANGNGEASGGLARSSCHSARGVHDQPAGNAQRAQCGAGQEVHPAAGGGAVAIDMDSPFFKWLHAVANGADVMITPTKYDALLAPGLGREERAALYCDTGPRVDPGVLREALHWAVHAAAAYGSQTYKEEETKRKGHSTTTARVKLRRLAWLKRQELDQVPEPARATLTKRRFMRQFVAGQQVARVPDEDVIYLSYVNQALGSTPYFIVLDQARKAVVVSLRGSSSFADLITDLVERPLELGSWLPEDFKRDHGIRDPRAHGGILSAAKAVLADLNRHQILHILLAGEPRPESTADQGGAEEREGHRSPAEYQRLLRERGVDCRGWRLVVTGHSLGAAVAVLIGIHLRSWAPAGVKVWAFSPPGGFVTADVAHATEDFVATIIVGKDVISRTSAVSFERLQDQLVVALARCKLSKMSVLLRARSHNFRAQPPDAVFHAVHKIPAEALAYVRSYFESKCAYFESLVPMQLPGRCVFLRRLKPPRAGARSWEAVWVAQEQVVEEGIVLSRHQASDHYTQRLLRTLEETAGVTREEMERRERCDAEGAAE